MGLLVLAGAGSYLFFSGFMLKNPAKLGEQITNELKEKGLSVFCEIDKDWTAILKGTVKSPTDKEAAINIVKGHKEVKDMKINVDVQTAQKVEGDTQIRTDLSQFHSQPPSPAPTTVAQTAIPSITKAVIAENFTSFNPQPIGVASLFRVAPGERKSLVYFAYYNYPKADFGEKSLGVVKWFKDGSLVHEGCDEELLVDFGNYICKPRLSFSVPGRYEAKLILAGKELNSTRFQVVESAVVAKKPKALKDNIKVNQPPQPASPDPAKIEGDINKALRNAGLSGITAEVGDDMSVTLKGSTVNPDNKSKAFDIAKSFNGIRKVRDRIFVVR